MRKLLNSFVLLWMAVLAGCATYPQFPSWSDRNRPKVFKLSLTTEPEGARVIWKQEGGNRAGKKTPGSLSFLFVKNRTDTILGDFGIRSWVPKISDNQPWEVREEEEEYVFTTPQLYLQKDGYKPEVFSYEWRVPKGFKLPDAQGRKTIPVTQERSAHVILRTPTKPQFARTVTLECESGPAKIYAKTSKGELGKLIGETPYEDTFGFGAQRSTSGEIVNWKHWVKNHADLWRVSEEGVLKFDAFMVGDGFLPQDLQDFPVMQIELVQPTKHKAVVKLTKPDTPDAIFSLQMDSLPSQATVYMLREDGSLGGEVGRTPFELKVGLAQELALSPTGEYVHKDWIIWDPSGTVRWELQPDGSTLFYLSCSLYRDGFAPENVTKPLFNLTPGRPYPTQMVLTVPLYKPEHAAIREAKNQPPIIIPAPAETAAPQRRPAVIWKAPQTSAPQAEEAGQGQAPAEQLIGR